MDTLSSHFLSYSLAENVSCSVTTELKDTLLDIVEEAGEGGNAKLLLKCLVFLEEILELGESGITGSLDSLSLYLTPKTRFIFLPSEDDFECRLEPELEGDNCKLLTVDLLLLLVLLSLLCFIIVFNCC